MGGGELALLEQLAAVGEPLRLTLGIAQRLILFLAFGLTLALTLFFAFTFALFGLCSPFPQSGGSFLGAVLSSPRVPLGPKIGIIRSFSQN